MITLTLIQNDNETSHVLNLEEEDWEFSIRLGSNRILNDNFLTIANPDKNFSNSEDVVAFYNLLKTIPPADITKVILEVDGVKMFDSSDFNFYFLGMFLQYQFVYMETNINRVTYIENKVMVAKGKGERDKLEDWI